MIVVRPSYRLRALDWAHFTLISKELAGAINLGLQDQVASLNWVSENKGVFGGDKDNITVSGESSGATTVSHLFPNPAAFLPFRRAVLQSLSPFNTWCTQRPEQAAEIARLYLGILKVDKPADLMTVDADRLLTTTGLLGQYFDLDKNAAWNPLGGVVHGTWILNILVKQLVSGGIDGLASEIMLGIAEDERLTFRSNSVTLRSGTVEAVLKVIAQVFDERAPAALDEYHRLNPIHAPGRLLSDIMSFKFFKFSTLEIASTLSAQDIPTYVFEFAYEMHGLGGALHAVHTGDMPFNLEDLPRCGLWLVGRLLRVLMLRKLLMYALALDVFMAHSSVVAILAPPGRGLERRKIFLFDLGTRWRVGNDCLTRNCGFLGRLVGLGACRSCICD